MANEINSLVCEINIVNLIIDPSLRIEFNFLCGFSLQLSIPSNKRQPEREVIEVIQPKAAKLNSKSK